MAMHLNILAWQIPWTQEPGGVESMRMQKDTGEHTHTHTHTHTHRLTVRSRKKAIVAVG